MDVFVEDMQPESGVGLDKNLAKIPAPDQPTGLPLVDS
jgi:hypothetical protein